MRAGTWLLVLLLAACAGPGNAHDASTADRQSGRGPATGSICPSVDPPTYGSFGRAFLEAYCTRCHSSAVIGAARMGAPSSYDFDSAELVRTHLDRIDGSSAAGPDAINTWMPIDGPAPSEAERRRLGEWLACGAP